MAESHRGRHIKTRHKMSRETLTRLTIALYMLVSFTAGTIVELLVCRYGN